MKRSLLVILALLLSLSLCLVGCNMGGNEATQKPTENQAGENKNDNSNNNVETSNNDTPKLSPQEIVINTFNSEKLGELVSVLEEGIAADAMDMIGGEAMSEELKEVLSSFAVGADVAVTQGSNNASVTLAIKDNYIYFKNTENNEIGGEGYAFLDDEQLTVSVKNGDEWVSQSTPYESIMSDGDTAETEAYMEMLEKVLGAIKNANIPALTEEYLTEKDGMLVLNNDYFIDIIDKNVEAIATAVGEELSAEDKTEGMEQIKNVISALGLELAFGTDEDSITKVSVAIKIDADSEYGKELVESTMLESMELVIELTSDGKNVKQLDFNTTSDYSDLIEGFKYENNITIASIFDGDQVVGADIDAEIGAIEFDYDNMISDAENPDYSYTQVFATITVDGVIDFSKINTAGADVIKLTATSKTNKAVKLVETYDPETDEYSEPTVEKVLTDSELAEHAFDLSIDLSLKATSSVKLALTINTELPDEDPISISGSVYLTEVTNFPAVPDEVKNPAE